MSPLPLSWPCSLWHRSQAVHNLLADLGVRDVRLTLVRGCPGPDRLEWHADSDHGAATFAALDTLRREAVGPAFAMARDDRARAVALAAAQRAPMICAVVAMRFGDPGRWLGFGPIEATRRFRANWA
jgi:hypothetical protein